jgi:hypothetical protein
LFQPNWERKLIAMPKNDKMLKNQFESIVTRIQRQ